MTGRRAKAGSRSIFQELGPKDSGYLESIALSLTDDHLFS